MTQLVSHDLLSRGVVVAVVVVSAEAATVTRKENFIIEGRRSNILTVVNEPMGKAGV